MAIQSSANQFNRKYGVSPAFQYKNASSITAGSYLNIHWESQNANALNYLPFNLTRIINNGEDVITFYPNQDTSNAILVPSGTIITIDRQTIPALTSFRIENSGTNTISANKIFVTSSKEGENADSVVQRLFNRFMGGQN